MYAADVAVAVPDIANFVRVGRPRNVHVASERPATCAPTTVKNGAGTWDFCTPPTETRECGAAEKSALCAAMRGTETCRGAMRGGQARPRGKRPRGAQCSRGGKKQNARRNARPASAEARRRGVGRTPGSNNGSHSLTQKWEVIKLSPHYLNHLLFRWLR